MTLITTLGEQARSAARVIAAATTAQKNAALLAIADKIEQETRLLKNANQEDIVRATNRGMEAAMLDRLELTA